MNNIPLFCFSILILLFIFPTQPGCQLVDDSFNPILSVPGRVEDAEIRYDNKILVRGEFSLDLINLPTVNCCTNFALLNEDGTIDSSFVYDKRLNNYPIKFVFQEDGKIIICGDFEDEDNNFLGNILRLLPNGQIDSTFQAYGDESIINVIDLEILPNQNIFFLYRKDNSTNGVKLIDKNGFEKSFPTILDSYLNLVDIGVQSNNDLLISGKNLILFNSASLVRLDSLGQVDESFQYTEMRGSLGISRMKISPGGKLALDYEGGGYRNQILDSNGSSIFVTEEIINANLFPFSDSIFYLFNYEEGYSINSNTNEIKNLNVNPIIFRDFEILKGDLLVTGLFSNYDNLLRSGILKFEVGRIHELEIDSFFNPRLLYRVGVRDLVVQADKKIVIAGGFKFINGIRTERIARLHPNGNLDTTFKNELVNFNTISGLTTTTNGDVIVYGEKSIATYKDNYRGLALLSKDGAFKDSLENPGHLGIGEKDISLMENDFNGNIYFANAPTWGSTWDSQILFKYSFDSPATYSLHDYTSNFNFITHVLGLTAVQGNKLLTFGHKIDYEGNDPKALVLLNSDGTINRDFVNELASDYWVFQAVELNNGNLMITGDSNSDYTRNQDIKILNPNGTINKHLAIDFGMFHAYVEKFYKMDNGDIVVTGFFDSFNGVDIPYDAFIIDQEGEFVQNFLPELDYALIHDIIPIGNDNYYVAGVFKQDNEVFRILQIKYISNSVSINYKPLEIDVFPNPINNNTLNFKAEENLINKNADIYLFNKASGQLVYQSKIIIEEVNTLVVKDLINSSYILKIDGKNFSRIGDFIKF